MPAGSEREGAGAGDRPETEGLPSSRLGMLVTICKIMRCFTAQSPVLGVTEIRRKTGIPLPTVQSYLRTLIAGGYIYQTRDRKYQLGLKVTELGMSALSATGLPEAAHEHLEQLRDNTGYTVGLAMLDGSDVVYVQRLVGSRHGSSAINLDVQVGARLPAWRTATGKILLAHLSNSAREPLLPHNAVPEAPGSDAEIDPELKIELERAHDEGVATEENERGTRLAAVAVPVRGQSGEVLAAIDIAAHKPIAELTTLLPLLLLTAKRTSQRLGYQQPITVEKTDETLFNTERQQ